MILRRPAPAALLVLLAAALLLRLFHLGDWPLWLDESWSRWMAEQPWPSLRDSAARYDTHPPVYYSLLKIWLGIAPPTPFAMRLLSALAGVALVPLAWLCAREIGALRRGPWPALIAAALVTASPALIAASRQARPYSFFALAFAVALWAALRLARGDGGRHRSRLAPWLVYLIALEGVLWLHSLGILFAASLGGGLFLALAQARRLRREITPFFAIHLVALLAWLPALLVLLEHRRNWSVSWLRFSWDQVAPGLASGLATKGWWALPLFGLAAIGLWAMLRARPRRPAMLLLAATALGPAALSILLSVFSSPVFLPRTLVPSALPLLLLVAAGAVALPSRAARLAFALVAIALLTAGSWQLLSRAPEEKWDKLSLWLDRHVAADEEVWLLPNELALPLGYARSTHVWHVRGVPAPFPAPHHAGPRYTGTAAVPGLAAGDAARMVAEARGRGLRGIWVVSRLPGLFDPGRELPAALGSARRLPAERAFAPLLVEHYRLKPERP